MRSGKLNMAGISLENYGRFVCEAVRLRRVAGKRLSKTDYKEFVADFDDLVDVDNTPDRQMRILDRMRRSYSKRL